MKLLSFVVVNMMAVFLITACGGGSGTSYTASSSFDLTCDINTAYMPALVPDVTTATTSTAATTTVIALHGKNGAPTRSHMISLAADLNAQGYDVSMPYMPWHDFEWDGSLCDAMSYVNSLIADEKNAGKNIILLGHSLAGPIVLSYAALSNTTKPDAVVVLAPGHFVHNSSVLKNLHAASVLSATDRVNAGLGDDIVADTFQTSNEGTLKTITTTPNIYLSYHDTKQFPDIKSSIPLVTKPVLWLAGLNDSLTTSAKVLGIIDTLPSAANYSYEEIAGTHFTLVENVTAVLDPWFQGL